MRGRSGWLAGRDESPTRPARHGAIGHRGTEARRKPNNSLCLGVSVAHFSVSRSPCDDFRHGLQALNRDMELRAVLVDDEQLARDELGYLLGQVGGVEVIGQAGNGLEALDTIERLQPDLVFLDVQMPGLTGFEVARRIVEDGRAGSQIIFVTAYDQHAIEAFEVNAVDYLLKPVDPNRLEVAVQRARRRVSSDLPLRGLPHVDTEQLEKIIQLVTDRQSRRERLAIKVGERFLLVQADE